ncbi:MAG: N-formylglutamate amidohydrolase [Opitutaceae bacterium]|nr:N-formylglutamate amidohydrolase [Opitutaceae bacterium]
MSSTTSAALSHVLTRPSGPSAPLVFDSPHSCIDYPGDFQPTAPPAAIRSTWDAFVDELWADVPAAGGTLLAARFPRAYIDANRAANDIDPALLAMPWPDPIEVSEHSGRGMGLIRRYALPGVPMYDRLLSVAEVRARIETYYQPYRAALRSLIDETYARHGSVWHFNCHSMKSRGNAMNRDAGALRPDFVIGDRDGTAAASAVTAWVAEFFVRQGYSVGINNPYRGADILRVHGDPPRCRHSMQIEINRALYMDEANFTRGPRFGQVRNDLGAFARAVAAYAGTTVQPGFHA